MFTTLFHQLQIALLQASVYLMSEWPLAQHVVHEGHSVLVKYDLVKKGSYAILVSALGAFIGIVLGILIGIFGGRIQ